MKIAFIGLCIAVLAYSCGPTQSDKNANSAALDSTAVSKIADSSSAPQHPSVDGIVTAYLDVKNALVSDDPGQAAKAGDQLYAALENQDTSAFTSSQQQIYTDVKEDMAEHAEHIGSNKGNIKHQREHFDMLSRDLLEVVKRIKPSVALYHDHCPMYNAKKGAPWLSETKEVRNPYYGKEMLECGEVKEEIN